MNGFANRALSLLLGWLKTIAQGMWQFISSPSEIARFEWLGKNWIAVALTLIILGVLVDRLVWFFRWRPDLVWRTHWRHFIRLFGHKKDREENREDGLSENGYYEPVKDVAQQTIRLDDTQIIQNASYTSRFTRPQAESNAPGDYQPPVYSAPVAEQNETVRYQPPVYSAPAVEQNETVRYQPPIYSAPEAEQNETVRYQPPVYSAPAAEQNETVRYQPPVYSAPEAEQNETVRYQPPIYSAPEAEQSIDYQTQTYDEVTYTPQNGTTGASHTYRRRRSEKVNGLEKLRQRVKKLDVLADDDERTIEIPPPMVDRDSAFHKPVYPVRQNDDDNPDFKDD